VAAQTLRRQDSGSGFEAVEYPLPEALTRGKSTVTARFEAERGSLAGPAYGLRVTRA